MCQGSSAIRTLVHVSDLHFGNNDEALVPALAEAVNRVGPDVVAVSGDLTQHATEREFGRARALLDLFTGVRIVVPGNHDLSFYNPWKRFTQRLRLYKQYITDDLDPIYRDAELIVAGLNTARVPLFRGGRFSASQMSKVELRMRDAGDAVRVLVTHHPFDLPPSYASREIVRGARQNMVRLLDHVDVLLAGHHHLSHAGGTAERYKVEGRSAVFVQAGTALSLRRPGENNSFNVLRFEGGSLSLTVHSWTPESRAYEPARSHSFRRTPGASWEPAA